MTSQTNLSEERSLSESRDLNDNKNHINNILNNYADVKNLLIDSNKNLNIHKNDSNDLIDKDNINNSNKSSLLSLTEGNKNPTKMDLLIKKPL